MRIAKPVLLCAATAAALLALAGTAGAASRSEQEVAIAIREKFESALFSLPLDVQRHYAERLYRMTGDERYLPPLIAYAMTAANILRHDAESLDDAGYVRRKVDAMLEGRASHCLNLGKTQARRSLLRKWGDIAFYLEMLCRLNIVRSYGLLASPHFERTDEILAALRKQSFARFVVDEEVLRTYGAQLANYVTYLHDLEVVDLRSEYVAALRQVLGRQDEGHPGPDLTTRVYVLAHLILAASRYYQVPVERGQFGWVFDYFEEHIDRILRETKPDAFAEVGICFALAGEVRSPVVAKVRSALVAAFEPEVGMIPAQDGSADLAKGEHRNVLALMLFTWPARLHPGPDLRQVPAYRALLPPR